jgi:hypothetical protein
MKIRTGAVLVTLLASSLLIGQDSAPPPAMGDCMKHCQEMAAAKQKAHEAQMAAQEKMDAAFQEVRAELATAKTAKGEKKVAALEAALEKLVAFHDAMHAQMQAAGPGGMGHGAMGHMGHGSMGSCCGAMAAVSDCPMMKGEPPAKN